MWDSEFFVLSQIPGLGNCPRDCPRSPGQSLAYVTVPKTQSPDIMGFYF